MAKKQVTDNRNTVDYREEYPRFTSDMKPTHTILVPDMMPYHFDVAKYIFAKVGYNIEVLHNETRNVIDEGLKHVHNDTCFPALCTIGQYLDALKSGKYDVDHTALLMTQTGGGCRASNYIPLIRKAIKAEFPQVPVVSLNFSGLEKDSGFELPLASWIECGIGIFYCDEIMSFYNQTLPYEVNKGDTEKARLEAIDYICHIFDEKRAFIHYKKISKHLLEIFKKVEVKRVPKVKVGIVGEIYVKYSRLGNSHLEDFLHSEDCEVVLPGLMDFILYCIVNNINDRTFYGRNTFLYDLAYRAVYKFLRHLQKTINKMIKKDGYFEPMHDFEHVRHCADKVINQGVKMGEGWLIPAEMAAMAETGTDNIVCAQPFGCLPNHIAGKGVIRTLKNFYPDENIVPVDYDPSATRVNQENRIKLMLATARENLQRKIEAETAAKKD